MKKVIVLITALCIIITLGTFLYMASHRGTTATPDEATNTLPGTKGPLIFPEGSGAGLETIPGETSAGGTEDAGGIVVGGSPSASFPDLSSAATNTKLVNSVKTISRISHGPVAGATVEGTVRGVNLFVRYIEKGSGHIYDYRPIGGGEDRISGATIPRIQEAYWGNKGQTALVRYVEENGREVKNYLIRLDLTAPATGSTSTERIKGTFIQDDLADVVVAPRGEEKVACTEYLSTTKTLSRAVSNDPTLVRKLQSFLMDQERGTTTASVVETGLFDEPTAAAVMVFQKKYGIEATGAVGPATRAKINAVYCEQKGGQTIGTRLFTLSRGNGNAGVLGDFDHTTGSTHFLSPIEEWQVAWPEKNTLVLTTAPANTAVGYAYTLSAKPSTKPLSIANLVPLIGGIKGLTLLVGPTLERMIYSSSGPRGLQTFLQVGTGPARSFPLVTLPADKCTWSRQQKFIVYCAAPSGGIGAGEPDNWYQGRSIYSDNIYSVNLETDTVTLLYPAGSIESIDVKNLFVAEDDSHLFFVDKQDGYLWQLSLGFKSED